MGESECHDLGSYKFEINDFFPKKLFFKITKLRIHHSSQIIKEECKARITRKQPWDFKMVIIAADHPARNVTNVGLNQLAMANRHEYLGRIIRTLILERVDGVMATPDIID
ncbi:MAG: hypothetical protein P8Y23_16790, partial [Candidatus Lokiarchaeota archaeon]